jgi:hypothetical protein
LLLHGALAVIVVLTWRKLPTLNPGAPVVVELAPPPVQPEAQPAEPTFATAGAEAGRPESAERADIDHPFAQLPTKQAKGESEPTFAAQSREPIAPVERADENAADARTASGGGTRTAPVAGLSSRPIDTRIAPSFGARGKQAPRQLTRTLSPLAHSAKQAGAQAPARRLSALQGSIVINAIGARVEDRVRARANASGNGARNAVGSAMANDAGSASAKATDSVVTNAIGIAVSVRPNIPTPGASERGTGAMAPAGGRPVAGINGTGINGTGMGRLASGTGAIGGPAKNVSGVLSGTDFRPRHP